MRILVLAPFVPWPLDMGSKIRVYHSLQQLSKSHDVTLACLDQSSDESLNIDPLMELADGMHIVPAPSAPRWQTAARSLIAADPYRVVKFHSEALVRQVHGLLQTTSVDLIWVHFLNMLSYLPREALQANLIALDQHNADERMWARYAQEGTLLNRAFARQNLWKLRRFQRQALGYVDVLLSVSDVEADFMRSRVPASCAVWTMPNGVDVEHFRPSDEGTDDSERPVVMFCGSMDVTMNADAVIRFAEQVFPHIRKRRPNTEFWIVGRYPTWHVRELGQWDGITVTGAVDDVRPYYEQATVVVAPFRYGAGTKLKVLEAMAMGVPVVATPIGCQGIEAEPGRHLYVEETDNGLADRVVELLEDSEARNRLAAAGRSLVESRYSWEHIVGETVQRLEQRLAERD